MEAARGILHLALPFVVAGAVLCIPIESPVLTRRGGQADSTGLTAIDPGAMEHSTKWESIFGP